MRALRHSVQQRLPQPPHVLWQHHPLIVARFDRPVDRYQIISSFAKPTWKVLQSLISRPHIAMTTVLLNVLQIRTAPALATIATAMRKVMKWKTLIVPTRITVGGHMMLFLRCGGPHL